MGAYRELELTLQSAQELKNVNLITRMDVYAVVSISGDPLTRQCTEPDTYGGRNPCWDATFRFAVPPTAASAAGASLHVLLRTERFLGDRDVGEVVIPLAEILAGASGPGPQPPQVASYQVRKLHRWEPRGVLNVSFRLGPVVAPVPAVQSEPPVVMANPVGVAVPPQQQASPSHSSPAKPDAYRPPPPSPPPRPAAGQEAAAAAAARARSPALAPAPSPTPAPPPTSNGGLGQAGPTHVYMGPHSLIIFGSAPTTGSGPPTRTTASPARSTIISPSSGKKGDVNWALLPYDATQGGNWASAGSESTLSVSVISPRSRNEDRWRPSLLPQPQQQQQAPSSPAAASPHSPHRLAAAAASPFSSRSSSFSSPLSPYSSAHASPSPFSSSPAHSSTRSPYSYSAHPSAATSPHQPLRPPPLAVADDGAGGEVTHGTNYTFRSASSRGAAAVSSPLPSSSPLVPKQHSSVVPSL